MLDILEFNSSLYSALSKSKKKVGTVLNYKPTEISEPVETKPQPKKPEIVRHSDEEETYPEGYKGMKAEEFYSHLK